MIEAIKEKITMRDLLNRLGIEVQNGFIHSIYKEEKTPSLKIYEEDNRYHCFATDQGGDVIDFYREYYRIDNSQAVKELAEIAGVKNSTINRSREPEKLTFNQLMPTRLLACLSKKEREYFHKNLTQHYTLKPDDVISDAEGFRYEFDIRINRIQAKLQHIRLKANKEIFAEMYRYAMSKGFDRTALNYLMKDRGLQLRALEQFKIFFISNYYELNQHLKKVFDLEDLQRAGLMSDKGNLIFAKHRIIIPYLHNNEIVYMRARYYDENGSTHTEGTKYIGLRNDELGVNRAKRLFNHSVGGEMLDGEKLYITEGEFDTIALSGLGYNAVGIPGAGSLPDLKKLEFMKNFHPVICVDNDEAGAKLRNKLERAFFSLKIPYSIKKLNNKDVNDFLMTGQYEKQK